MTSVGDGNGGEPSAPIPNANSVATETLPSDRGFSRSPSPESGDMMKGETLDEPYVESTMQFDDTVPLDGAFETQILDTGGETQLVDFGGETQAIDCEDGIGNVETQLLLDACDTQVAFDSHSEDSGGTEVLGSDDEISDGGSHGKGGYSRDEKKMSSNSLSKDSETREQSTGLTDEPCSSGAFRRGFTSIRVASLRASGLAARSMYLNGACSVSCSLLSTRQSSEEQAGEDNGTSFQGAYIKSGEEFDQECDAQTSLEISEMEHGKKCKSGSGAVRRLFAEDVVDNMPDETADSKEVPLGNDQLAGLSYVESQEPGDLSQANALDFVDRFLKDNVEQLHEELDFGKTVGRKPLSMTSTKGPQNLAKSASRITVRAEVFDWDDGREDEGGGDTFCRLKEDFFDGGSSKCRSVTLPRKHRNRKQGGHGDRDEPSSAPASCKTTGLLRSDLKATLRMGGKSQMMAKVAEINHKRDIASQLDEQSKRDSRDNLEAITGDVCAPDMLNVGFDTQLAAEAMEELCQGEPLPREDNCDISISTRKLRSTKRDYNEQSKKSAITLQKHSNDEKRCRSSGHKTRKLEMTGLTANRNKKLNKLPSKNLQHKNRDSLGRRQAGEFGKQNVTRTSNVVTSASKQQLLDKVGLFTPIASRTRSSLAVNQVQRTESLLCNYKKATDGADNVGVCKRKRTTRERSRKKTEDDSMVKARGNSPEHFLAVESGKRSIRQKRIKSDAKSKGDLEVQLPARNFDAAPENGTSETTSFKLNMELLAEGSNMSDLIGLSEANGYVGATLATHNREANAMLDHTPREKCNGNSARTPVVCSTPFNDASPVCVGNGYMNPSCKKNLSRSFLRNEIKSLNASGPEPSSAYKNMRKRRDMSDICVLYSHHLDDDIIKQQKKILARLGASAVSSIAEATHFITDKFVRTRNMLEAIASGKPVVTHLWLESCGQANCFLDEKNYILRDARKEKQFGFSMPVSLARACQLPLLQGRRVLITPNAKPGKDIISSLVKAVGGQPVERIGRSAVKDEKVLDDLLILSCEDDYDMCLPFLEKGAAVYSSELLLNGIVTQKLEYERHRLFADHVKRTRSTIWLKKDGNNFVPVAKHK